MPLPMVAARRATTGAAARRNQPVANPKPPRTSTPRSPLLSRTLAARGGSRKRLCMGEKGYGGYEGQPASASVHQRGDYLVHDRVGFGAHLLVRGVLNRVRDEDAPHLRQPQR